MTHEDGWSGLFATAFESSRNAMVLTDERRVIVEPNAAFLTLLGRTRDAVVGAPLYAFVAGGPLATSDEWAGVLAAGQFSGEAALVDAEGLPLVVQWAATTEIVTGRRLVLFVTLNVSRWGSRSPRTVDPDSPPRALTPREREIVHHLSLGAAGRRSPTSCRSQTRRSGRTSATRWARSAPGRGRTSWPRRSEKGSRTPEP